MKFIPEEWEPIYHHTERIFTSKSRRRSADVRFDSKTTIGEMIDARLDADTKIGLAKKGDTYSVFIQDELFDDVTEVEIRNTLVSSCKKIPDFIVCTVYDTVSYCIEEDDEGVFWLKFVGVYMKESETVWYQIKEYVKENELGAPNEIVTTLTEKEKMQELSDIFCWTAWCGDWVIFPTQYDGYYNIASVPRNPCGHKTFPVGGG